MRSRGLTALLHFLADLFRRRPIAVTIIALLFLAGVIAYQIYLPRAYLAAQENGNRFEEENPNALGLESDLWRATAGNPEGPTLFLIHGSPGHWKDFGIYLKDPQLTSRFLLVAPDRPGYGGSGTGDNVESMESQAAQLKELTASRPRPFLWLGHSFGASVVARLAMDHPDSVDGLLLVAGAMSPEFEKPRWFHLAANQQWMRNLLPEDLDVSNQESLTFASEFEEMVDRWDQIASPTLILHGRRDWMAQYGHVEFAHTKMTNAPVEVVTLEYEGHLLLWHRYEVVRDSIFQLARMIENPPQPSQS